MLSIRINEGVKLLKRGGYMIIVVGTFPREGQHQELYIDALNICKEAGLIAGVRRIRDLAGADYAVICRKGVKAWKSVCGRVDKHIIDLQEWQDERNEEHPAPFSHALAEVMIAKYSKPGDVVVDPFMGSGTTILVAKCMGRKGIGIDLSEKYCEDARRHLADLKKNAWYQRYKRAPIGITSIFDRTLQSE